MGSPGVPAARLGRGGAHMTLRGTAFAVPRGLSVERRRGRTIVCGAASVGRAEHSRNGCGGGIGLFHYLQWGFRYLRVMVGPAGSCAPLVPRRRGTGQARSSTEFRFSRRGALLLFKTDKDLSVLTRTSLRGSEV